MKTALMTGLAGQDRTCLAGLLIRKDDGGYGVMHRVSTFDHDRFDRRHGDLHALELMRTTLRDAGHEIARRRLRQG